ncbi:hypothetical protein [uncultured Roseibium sp.]|uniref:hypothetical protein n=1 Tax=uncultured Roseibium sp. TaxID=1936171 RepID=UPI00261C97CE|nr:hypothetical protein [uncultured Roseibium sp.]
MFERIKRWFIELRIDLKTKELNSDKRELQLCQELAARRKDYRAFDKYGEAIRGIDELTHTLRIKRMRIRSEAALDEIARLGQEIEGN